MVTTVQLKDMTLVSVNYDTSILTQGNQKANLFEHQSLINNSPATLASSVSGSYSSTTSATATFTETVTKSA